MDEAVPEGLQQARERFGGVVSEVRAELHRYCARMVGSAIDGEDVVQDTLARAFDALSTIREPPSLRPWLFRIAHNRAVDHLLARDRARSEPLDEAALVADEDAPLDQREAAALALSLFLELTPLQRSCAILKDVLGHSVEEIAETLGLTPSAAKSALHRARSRLRALAGAGIPAALPPAEDPDAALLARWVERFNARDWSALRSMLAQDVRVELLGRGVRDGAGPAGDYFRHYEAREGWRLEVGRVDSRPAVLVFGPRTRASAEAFAVVRFRAGRVQLVRDYSFAPYAMEGARVEREGGHPR